MASKATTGNRDKTNAHLCQALNFLRLLVSVRLNGAHLALHVVEAALMGKNGG